MPFVLSNVGAAGPQRTHTLIDARDNFRPRKAAPRFSIGALTERVAKFCSVEGVRRGQVRVESANIESETVVVASCSHEYVVVQMRFPRAIYPVSEANARAPVDPVDVVVAEYSSPYHHRVFVQIRHRAPDRLAVRAHYRRALVRFSYRQ